MRHPLVATVLLCALPAGAVETVRIAVGAEVKSATVSGAALGVGPDDDAARFAPIAEGRAVLGFKDDALTLNDVAVPDGVVRLTSLEAADRVLSVQGMRVRGDVVALKGRAGVQLVNVIALEDYLVGVLGSEMPRSFPEEALKAQAVAARTYALQKKLEGLEKPWHLGSSVISQVYKGLESDDPRTRAAVEATFGQVLTFRLQPIEAYFHSSCGGHTETGFEALGRDLPYLKSVECPCSSLPQSQWSLSLTRAEAQKALGARSASLAVQGRSRTGRAQRVQVAPGRTVDAVSFREKLGYMKVKSLAFEVAPRGDGWVFKGKGFGHGAGLCQWGANALAEKRWGYRRILEHYYPGTELQTLY